MKIDHVEIIDEYDEEGIIIKKTANGIPIDVRSAGIPTVIIQKKFMTREEIERLYGKSALRKLEEPHATLPEGNR